MFFFLFCYYIGVIKHLIKYVIGENHDSCSTSSEVSEPRAHNDDDSDDDHDHEVTTTTNKTLPSYHCITIKSLPWMVYITNTIQYVLYSESDLIVMWWYTYHTNILNIKNLHTKQLYLNLTKLITSLLKN